MPPTRRKKPPHLGDNPRILISRTDRIGDLVLSLPVVRSLKNAHAEARVDFLVRKETAPVVDGQAGVGQIFTFDPAWGDNRELTARLAVRKYNAVVCLYPRPELARIFARAKIPVRIGTGRRWYSYRFTHRVNISRRKSGRHEKDLNLDLLKPLGISPDYTLIPELEIDPRTGNSVPELLTDIVSSTDRRPLAVVHPGDGGSAANWALDRYVELVKLLVADGVKVVITGMPNERDKHLASFSTGPGTARVLTGRTELRQLMQILSFADLFIGGSTGPLHLAAALGTPVVGLYGPIYTTTPDRWGPCGSGHVVFVPDVEVCRCPVGHCRLGNCMDRIGVADVLAACRQKLRGEKTADRPQNKTPSVSDHTAREGLCT